MSNSVADQNLFKGLFVPSYRYDANVGHFVAQVDTYLPGNVFISNGLTLGTGNVVIPLGNLVLASGNIVTNGNIVGSNITANILRAQNVGNAFLFSSDGLPIPLLPTASSLSFASVLPFTYNVTSITLGAYSVFTFVSNSTTYTISNMTAFPSNILFSGAQPDLANGSYTLQVV